MAADITNTEYAVLSKQGADTTQNLTVNNDIVTTVSAEYKVDDIITFKFAGAAVDVAKSNPVITSDLLGNGAKFVFGLLNATEDTLTFRVTELAFGTDPANASTTKGVKLTLSGVEFSTASVLASGSATVTYAAQTSTGITLDSAKTNSTVLFEAKDQFVGKIATADKFNAVIDVESKRTKFEGTAPADTQDVLSVTTAQAAYSIPGTDPAQPADFVQPVTANKSTITINGNFSFLGKADATTGEIDNSGNVVTLVQAAAAGTDPVMKVYADKIVITDDQLDKYTVTVNVPGDVALTKQSFTADAVVGYAAKSVAVLDKADAGQWTLNGALVHVPYMPFRAGYSPIVNISNTSTQDGDVEVLVYSADTAWAAPKSYMLSKAAKAQAQTNITGALQAAGISGDVAFDIIVSAPASDIAVNALYYNNGDRAVINTVNKNEVK